MLGFVDYGRSVVLTVLLGGVVCLLFIIARMYALLVERTEERDRLANALTKLRGDRK